jgi:hypothetical protein
MAGPRALLEPNHSHFLFVDAGPGAEGQFGKEIGMRAALEDELSRGRPLLNSDINPDVEEAVSPVRLSHSPFTLSPFTPHP